jgi:hypothetical protein
MQFKMALRKALTTCIRSGKKIETESKLYHTIIDRIGKREVVGFGLHSEPSYIDCNEFPMPAIRYKEVTPDIQVKKIRYVRNQFFKQSKMCNQTF